MFVRTSTIQARPDSLDEGIKRALESAPKTVEGLDGSLGINLAVDRAEGRCVLVSGWASREAMEASRGSVRGARDEIIKALGAADAMVEEWEAAVAHVVHPAQAGNHTRATRVESNPSDIEGLIETYRATTIPAVEALPGFCAALLLVDRGAGKAVSVIAYDTREHLEASRARAAQIRSETTEKSHSTVVEINEFEMVMAGLRPPQ